MSFQKCPICGGQGTLQHVMMGMVVCPTCKGSRIIDQATGAPGPEPEPSEGLKELAGKVRWRGDR